MGQGYKSSNLEGKVDSTISSSESSGGINRKVSKLEIGLAVVWFGVYGAALSLGLESLAKKYPEEAGPFIPLLLLAGVAGYFGLPAGVALGIRGVVKGTRKVVDLFSRTKDYS